MVRLVELDDILVLCKKYAQARESLNRTVEEIRALRRHAVRSRMRGLRSRVATASAERDSLWAAIKANPQLFVKPRTRAAEGIKVGYRKQPGQIVCDDTRVIARIRKLFPERESELVQVKETLKRSALKGLDSKTLSAIGVAIVRVDDEVFIAAASDELDKLVEALMGEDENMEDAD